MLPSSSVMSSTRAWAIGVRVSLPPVSSGGKPIKCLVRGSPIMSPTSAYAMYRIGCLFFRRNGSAPVAQLAVEAEKLAESVEDDPHVRAASLAVQPGIVAHGDLHEGDPHPGQLHQHLRVDHRALRRHIHRAHQRRIVELEGAVHVAHM